MSNFHSGSTNQDDPVRAYWLSDHRRLLVTEVQVPPAEAVSRVVRFE